MATLFALSAACGDSDSNEPARDAGSPDSSEGEDAAARDAGSDASEADAAPELDASGVPPEVTRAAKEWPMANHDYAGTRATFDSPITAANIGTLTEAWSFELPGAGTFGAATSAPVVLDGVVYYTDMACNVFALDGATGATVWEHRYDDACGGPNGVAVGWGKLFVFTSTNTFAALDLSTGDELWRAPIEVPKNGGYTIAPLAYDGRVFLSTVPVTTTSQYLGGVNGTLYALDQATGDVLWSFATVEDETLWGHPELNSGGGAWYPPTIDLERARMYWGIGNPAVYPGSADFPNGTSRPGDNLYTNSVVALGVAQGELAWYHQERPHDLFDLDFQNPPMPVTVTIDGAERHLVIGSGKTGTVVALDADEAGELVWRTPVGKHENDDITEIPEAGIVVFPGDLGGVETPPAYAEGVVFVPVCNQGRQYFPTRSGDLDDLGTGELVALDVRDGSVKWRVDLETQTYGGTTVVNDVVIVPTWSGLVLGLDRETGEEVWRYMSPLGINAPVTVAGDLVLIPAGAGLGIPKLIALRLP